MPEQHVPDEADPVQHLGRLHDLQDAADDEDAAQDLARRDLGNRGHQDRRGARCDQHAAQENEPDPFVAKDFGRMQPLFTSGMFGAHVRPPDRRDRSRNCRQAGKVAVRRNLGYNSGRMRRSPADWRDDCSGDSDPMTHRGPVTCADIRAGLRADGRDGVESACLPCR